jgi:hypothetical protein
VLKKSGLFALVINVSRACAELLESWPADVVAFDWMLSATPPSRLEAAGVPACALVHCPYPLPVDGVPPLFSGVRPREGPLARVIDGVAAHVHGRRRTTKDLDVTPAP